MRVFGRGSLVLVTGGAGFIGARVAARLSADGFRVRVLDDLSTGRRERLQGVGTEGVDLEVVTGDVRCERTVREACHGAQGVIHLAAPPRPRNAHEERVAHDVTVTGTWNLLAAAKDEEVHRLVLASSAAVYGPRAPFLLHEEVATRPSCTEGAHKLAAETFARLFHTRDALGTVILRLFSVYGPGQDGSAEGSPLVARLVRQIARGEPLTIHGDGGQTRDLVHIDDVVRAVVAALKAPGAAGRTFNVASGEGLAVRTIAAILTELAGGGPAPRYLPMRPREPRDLRASIAAASAGLGWRPQVRLRDGLAACLAAARNARRTPPPIPKHAHGTPPPMLQKRGNEPAVALFQNRPPSWTVPEVDTAEGGSSIPVIIQEDPLWT